MTRNRPLAKALLALLLACGYLLGAIPKTLASENIQLGNQSPPPSKPSPAAESLADLPLVELPATVPGNDTLAVILTGDGGWAPLVRQVGETLSGQGMPVVGLNCLRYFWTPRQPDEMGHDLTRILNHYLTVWGKRQALLIGYSLGADVLPFMASRLPADVLSRVTTLALIGPGHRAAFEFRPSNWLGGQDKNSQLIMPELRKIQGPLILCLYGLEEKESLCTESSPPASNWKVIPLPGGHHFDGDYRKLALLILTAAQGDAVHQ